MAGRRATEARRSTTGAGNRHGSSLRSRLKIHWSEHNRLPGTVWPATSLVIGLLAPFALLIRASGFPPYCTPVHVPLLDPLVHALASWALLMRFRHVHRLDSWHLGLDRARLDAASLRTLILLTLGVLVSLPPLADPTWVDTAPDLFGPAGLLRNAARYAPGAATRWLTLLFLLTRAGAVAAAEAITVSGLLYATLRRRCRVLPAALCCALVDACLNARLTECGVDPCLWPTAQSFTAQLVVGLACALGYERWRTLWIAVAVRIGFELTRAAPGLTSVLSS
jgi:hypothetical protein